MVLVCNAPCGNAVAALGGFRFGTLAPGRSATASPPPAHHSPCGTSILCVAALRSGPLLLVALRSFVDQQKEPYADRETKNAGAANQTSCFAAAVSHRPLIAQLLPPLWIPPRPAVLPALRTSTVRELWGWLTAKFVIPSPDLGCLRLSQREIPNSPAPHRHSRYRGDIVPVFRTQHWASKRP